MNKTNLSKSDKVYRFWDWINSLPNEEYNRAQKHCAYFIGHTVRGIVTVDKGWQFNEQLG